MDKFECSGRCYECGGCEDLELQIYTEILFKSMGVNCETTREKMEKSLSESERLTKEIERKDIDYTKDELSSLRARRWACNKQFGDLVRTSSIVEYKCRKFKEIVENGTESK